MLAYGVRVGTNTLFSGKVVVTNGIFSFTFLLKILNIFTVRDRINYYAQDDINSYEAQGYFENFTVGGLL